MESSNMKILTNSIKLQYLLSRGNSILRNTFSERWAKYNGSDWNSSSARTFTFGIGRKVYEKFQKLHIQRETIEAGNLNEWDLTTLTDVLILTDFPTDIVSRQTKALERSKLEELKKVRNKLAHAPSVGIEDELFESMWRNASEVLVFFGCSKEDLVKIKSSSNLSAFQDENSSGHVNKANSEEATRLKNEANDLFNIYEFKKAIEVYSKAISLGGLLDSEKAILYSNRSVCYLKVAGKNKRHEKSEEIHCSLQDGKEAIKLNPTWFRGYYRTGNAYFELGKFREALEYFDSALSLSPGNEDLLFSRDNCRMKLGQETRREHIDPGTLPKSKDEELKDVQKSLGDLSLTDTDLAEGKKLLNNTIPGNFYVTQAQELLYGTKNTCDPNEAAKLYGKAASLGNADGMFHLGILYKDGRGVKQDFAMFIKLMREAASRPHKVPGTMFMIAGVAQAEYSLGLAYQDGIGVTQDDAVAAEWYRKASDHGFYGGSNNLGLFYLSGRGVPLNIDRGVQYLKLGARRGNTLSMLALAEHFLNIELDPREARGWFEQAVKHGNLAAQLDSAEFEQKLKRLEKKMRKFEDQLVEWEKVSNLSGNGMTLKSRLKRMMRALDPSMTDTVESIYSNGLVQKTTTRCAPLDFDRTVLEKYAQNGSITASQILMALSHFYKVEFLMDCDLRETETRTQIIHELAECYRICELVVKLLPHCKVQLCEIISETLKQSVDNAMTDLDKDARICFGHLQMDSLEHILIFSEQSKKKYPEEKAFHHLHSNMCGFLRKHELGVKETQKSLKVFPNDADLLFSLAAHLHSVATTIKQIDGVIQAYQDFIAVAPRDHRKVPEAYYSIWKVYSIKYEMKTQGTSVRKKNANRPSLSGRAKDTLEKEKADLMNKMEEYNQLRLKADKIQLPCYLPKESNQKAGVTKVKPTGESHMTQPEPDYVMFSDPGRILVLKSHREHMNLRRLQDKTKTFSGNTTSPINLQRPPKQLTGLKPMTFSEMDAFEDKFYEGRVIQVTSVDVAGFGALQSIWLVLEDENRNLLRAFFYNFPEKDEKIVQQKLGFGVKMTILNPYMRMQEDGQFGICVDDPASLILHSSSTERSCRLCMSDKADLHCGKCKTACYCSRKCQEMDWKLMKHKLVCVPL